MIKLEDFVLSPALLVVTLGTALLFAVLALFATGNIWAAFGGYAFGAALVLGSLWLAFWISDQRAGK